MKKILILGLFIANISHAISVQEATGQNFEEIVLKAKNPVIVDFFATWCQPCKTLKPTFHELAECYGNTYTFVEVDIDKAPQIAKSCGINQVPTFAIFNKGSMCAKFVGGLQKETFEQEVTKALTHNPE